MSYYRDLYGSSGAREVRGGIKAQTSSGIFGKSWWGRRWISTLESFDIGARLARGRTYARKGQVISIDISEGLVRAAVQGSRREPYNVEIAVKTFSEEERTKISDLLMNNVGIAAHLINGEMPPNIEEVFKENGLSLFPEKSKDLQTKCSCPDLSNPCKHIAAVYYLLSEEFDRDPFLLFRMRGIPISATTSLEAMHASPTQSPTARPPATPSSPPPELPPPNRFWHGKPFALSSMVARTPTINAHIIRRLGSPPFWRGEANFLQSMERVYQHASRQATELLEQLTDAE